MRTLKWFWVLDKIRHTKSKYKILFDMFGNIVSLEVALVFGLVGTQGTTKCCLLATLQALVLAKVPLVLVATSTNIALERFFCIQFWKYAIITAGYIIRIRFVS